MHKKNDKPAALDHVLYEMEMLVGALEALCRPRICRLELNGWTEVFAIHARNLNEFFAGKKSMRPERFVQPWHHSYTFNKEIARLASSRVAHLCYDRQRPEEKTQWPFELHFKGLRDPALEFLKAAVASQPLMAYHDNKTRTEALLAFLPNVRFRSDKQ